MNDLAEGFPEGVDSGLRCTTILRPQPCSHDAGGAMRYLCLIYSDDSQWSKMPKADQDKWLAEYRAFGEDIKRSGHYVGSERLEAASHATVGQSRNRKELVSERSVFQMEET